MKNITKGLGLSGAKRDIPSPILKANILSKVTLWWLNNHMWRGYKRPLVPSDIYTVVPDERAVHRVLKLERSWNALTPEMKEKRNSLLKASVISNWKLLFLALMLILLGEVCKFAQPFLIAEIVSYFKGKYVTQAQACGYATGMVVLMVLYAIVSTYGDYLCQVVAMRMRASCTALMARKATRLSSRGLSEISRGTVLNLLATDVEKFYNAASEFRGLFVGPIVLFSLLILMAYSLGISVLPAVGYVFLLSAFRLFMGNKSADLRKMLADWSDKRIHLVTEIVSTMRTIKAYCWEKPFAERATYLRSAETKQAGWLMYLNGLNLNLGHSCDRVVTFFLVLMFVFTDNQVNYKIAIQILTWMKMGQLGFMNFPIGYSMWKQMEASMTRIQSFLTSEEFKGDTKAKVDNKDIGIVMKNASASWALSEKHLSKNEKQMKNSLLTSIASLSAVAQKDNFVASGTFSLRNINLNLKSNMLVGLVGPVGSGKSSLMLTILGSLPLGAGTCRTRGKVAYLPQKPWIRADTIRNNILMGQTMNRARYSKVLGACALQKDVADMENGDATTVGNNGSGLSGGQRARISLARAVYRDADIYIMDDPFSALDLKVTMHIFNECLLKFLKGKLILFSTSNLDLLSHTDHVIVLEEGNVKASDNMEEVLKKVDLHDLITSQSHTHIIEDERADLFAKQDKKNMLMALLGNAHIKKEHAHIPKERSTSISVYLSYWKAGYGYVFMTLFCLFLMTQQVFSILGDWWLVYNLAGGSKKSSYGKKDYGGSYDNTTANPGSYSNTSYASDSGNSSYTTYDFNQTEASYAASSPYDSTTDINQKELLGPYAAFVWVSVACGLFSVFFGTMFVEYAANRLYTSMFRRILRAPMKLFSADSTGQMINRLSRDTGRMDDIIPITINATFLTAAIILANACYICVINYYVVVATLPFLVCLGLFVMYCIRAIRDTKRLESEFRTPTFEHLQHLLEGLDVVRAFELESLMVKEADVSLDRHTAAWHMYIGSMYWMKMRLNWMVAFYLAIVLTIALATPHSEAMATPLGLSLAYILVFMARVQYFATYSAMLDANMTSVEHVYEYAHVNQEPQLPVLKEAWPTSGNISFRNVNVVYPGSKMQALKDVCFKVHEGEKVGIVGRTGAGKTSVFNALLRLYYHTGTIVIDEKDIRKLPLRTLRYNITFILQEPMLHTGSLRFNLDPFSRFSDYQIWQALQKVQLKKKVGKLPGKLDVEVESDGGNFSGGQKQLLCMARALLNMNKIMILDEITADVDLATAKLIDKMLDVEFRDCTILHISHRIPPFMNCDKIMVMDRGTVAEMAHPFELLKNKEGIFYSIVKQHGETLAQNMMDQAANSYMKVHGPISQPQTIDNRHIGDSFGIHSKELPTTDLDVDEPNSKENTGTVGNGHISTSNGHINRAFNRNDGEEDNVASDETIHVENTPKSEEDDAKGFCNEAFEGDIDADVVVPQTRTDSPSYVSSGHNDENSARESIA